MVNFSEYILWTQSSATSGEDILLVDGNYLSSEEGENYFSYMSLISDDVEPQWKPLFENKSHHKTVGKNDLSRSFSIYQNNENCTLVKSSFLEKDDTGRRVAYLFCCPTLNLKDVITSLLSVSDLVNRSPNTADLSMISTLRYKKNILNIGLILLFLILVAIILWTLLK